MKRFVFLLFVFLVPVLAQAQQFDNPVRIPVSFYGTAVAGTSVLASSFTISGGSVGSTSASVATHASGATFYSSYSTVYVIPGRNYTLTASGSNVNVIVANFQPVNGCEVYVNGNKANIYSSGGTSYSFTLRVERINDVTSSLAGARAGACSSFPEDKPIWYVGLGSLRNGRFGGAVGFRSDAITSDLYTPSALVYDTVDASEVTVTRDASGYISQIQSREATLNVTTLTSTSYRVDVCYWSTPTTPYITYTVSQYAVSGGSGIRIDRIEDGQYWATVLTKVGGVWTKYDWRKVSATGAAIDTTHAITTTVSGSTSDVVYGTGTGQYTKKKIYTTVGAVTELASVTMGYGTTSAPVTSYSYYTSSSSNGWFDSVQSVIEPTGRWTKYEYYNTPNDTRAGQISRIYRPWLDAPSDPSTATTTNCYLETYDYSANYDGTITAPSSRIVTINGTTAGKTLWTYDWSRYTGVNSTHAIAQIVRQDYSSSSNNLTTTTLAYREDDADTFFHGKLHSVTHPDGTKESYAYYYGSWSTATNTFTPGSGGDRLILTFHGQNAASLGVGKGGVSITTWSVGSTSWNVDQIYLVPNLSTITETVVGSHGNLLFTGENVFVNTTSPSMERISATGYTTSTHNLVSKKTDLMRSVSGITVAQSHSYTAGQEVTRTETDGRMTHWTYDNWLENDTIVTAYLGTGSYTAHTQNFTYYDSGLVNKSDDASGVTSTYTYEATGRVASVSQPKPGSGTLTASYSYPSLRQTTITQPNGATLTAYIYLDGQPKEHGGTGQVDVQFSPSCDSSGNILVLTQNGSTAANGFDWITRDWLGRKIVRRTPQCGYAASSNTYKVWEAWTYNGTTGQLESVSTLDESQNKARLVADHLYDYGNLGLLAREGEDLGNDGVIDLASREKVTVHSTGFLKETSGYLGWLRVDKTSAYTGNNDGTTLTVLQETDTRLTKFNGGVSDATYGAVVSDVVSTDASGRVYQTLDYVKPASRARYRTQTAEGVNNAARSVWQDGYLKSETSTSGVSKTYTYNSNSLLTMITEGATNAQIQNNYYTGTSYLSSVVSTTGANTNATTTYAYAWDSAAHTMTTTTTDATGGVSYAMANALGLPWRTWGTGTQPSQIGYDAYGRKISLTTWRSGSFTGSSWPSSPGTGDVTTWNLYPATGAVKEKLYANSSTKKVSFTYNPLGQIATRTWLRGVVTTYAYSSTTADLTGVTYSDTTPAISYTYNRMRQVYTVSDAAGTRTIHHRSDLQTSYEEYGASFYGSKSLTYAYDDTIGPGRATGYSFNSSSSVSSTLTFDADTGQTATIKGALGDTELTFTLGYAAGTDWVNAVACGSFTRSTPLATKRDVIASVTTGYGAATRGNFTANVDLTAGGRRTGQKSYSASTVSDGSWSWMLGLGQGYSTTCTFDSYGQVATAPTPTASGVTDSQTLADRGFGWTYDLAGNRKTETYNNGGSDTSYTADSIGAYSAISGSLAEGSLTYDADGNLTQDGTWNYTYDAENRLTSMGRIDLAQGLSFVYDYMGRRIRKTVTGSSASDTKYLWFGWKIVAELAADGITVNRSFVWGPDFSDAQGNAGGAGSLLAQMDGAKVSYAMPDVFGNIAGYLNDSGTLVAATEFSLYGRVLNSTGLTTSYPFGYSCQYTDQETGLVYHGLRYYNPKHGRFINRDPIEEQGGNNLYAFCGNAPVNTHDVRGCSSESIPDDVPQWVKDIIALALNSSAGRSGCNVQQWASDVSGSLSPTFGNSFGSDIPSSGELFTSTGHEFDLSPYLKNTDGGWNLAALASSDSFGGSMAPNSGDVASTSLFIGQQIGDAGAVRQTYIDTVARLDPTDSAGRTAAKIAARADTPPLVAGVIEGVRPGTGPNPGSVGSANVTNPGVNSLGQTLRIGGTILVIGGLTYDAIDIYTSSNPARTATGAAGGWIGAYYGGVGGALAGTAARPGVGTIIGGVGGAFVGGYLGRQGALNGYDRLNPPGGSFAPGGGGFGGHGAGGTW